MIPAIHQPDPAIYLPNNNMLYIQGKPVILMRSCVSVKGGYLIVTFDGINVPPVFIPNNSESEWRPGVC